jgi:pimeloyl-ACP methyl ester carboxylesterase
MKKINTTVRYVALTVGMIVSGLSFQTSANQHSNTLFSGPEQIQQACMCFDVKVVGAGPAILLIPGVASSGDVWQSTVEALQADYELHILTLAGFAGVKPIPMQHWGEGYLAIQEQAILAYIKDNKLDKPIVIGHSLGGYLALALAANTPEHISGAINVDGLPALGALFAEMRSSQNEGTTNNNAEQQQMAAFDPVSIAKTMTSDTLWQQRIVTDMYRSDGMTSGRVMGELMQADLRPKLRHIEVPVLTLGALQNGAPYSTPEQVKISFESQLASAPTEYHRFAFTHNSKHFIMADAPNWLNQEILQFLRANKTRSQ